MIQISVVHIELIAVFCSCVCVWGVGGGVVFPYDALCGLFGWNCALHVCRISYLG